MYEVEIVGLSNLFTAKIAHTNALIDDFKDNVMPEMANVIRRKIQERISAAKFKGSRGDIYRAVTVQIDRENLEIIVYNDERIAPYTRYQEEGVHQHKMTYLIGATIPYKIVNGKFVYSRYGSGKTQFAKVTEASFNRTNPRTGRPSWEHPGYKGKYFYRNGLKDSLKFLASQMEGITFRIAKVGD